MGCVTAITIKYTVTTHVMLAIDSLNEREMDERATAIIVELMGTSMAPSKSETISAHSFFEPILHPPWSRKMTGR